MRFSSGTRVGSYEILAPLGSGGMGEVYRARDMRLKRDVAMKVLPGAWASDSERVDCLQREAELLAALNHSGIAAIYGLEESPDFNALILELVDGETLAERWGAVGWRNARRFQSRGSLSTHWMPRTSAVSSTAT